MSARYKHVALAGACLLALARYANASVAVTHDFGTWSSRAGPFTTLDFTGFAPDTLITTQYESFGAVFTDGPGGSSDYILGPSVQTFPQDGWGLNGGLNGEIHIAFSTPQLSFATHFAGFVQYWLYNRAELIYESPWFFSSPEPGEFAGLLSTRPFDRVVILGPRENL